MLSVLIMTIARNLPTRDLPPNIQVCLFLLSFNTPCSFLITPFHSPQNGPRHRSSRADALSEVGHQISAASVSTEKHVSSRLRSHPSLSCMSRHPTNRGMSLVSTVSHAFTVSQQQYEQRKRGWVAILGESSNKLDGI